MYEIGQKQAFTDSGFGLLFYVSVVQKLEYISNFGEFLVLVEQRTTGLVALAVCFGCISASYRKLPLVVAGQ